MKLLTKNNFGHSTLTINDSLYNYKGYAPLINYTDGDEPEVEYDMSDIFTGQVLSANRKFIKLSKSSCRIEDDLVFNDNTKKLTWGMMTVAEVYPTNGGAILKVLDTAISYNFFRIINFSLNGPLVDIQIN